MKRLAGLAMFVALFTVLLQGCGNSNCSTTNGVVLTPGCPGYTGTNTGYYPQTGTYGGGYGSSYGGGYGGGYGTTYGGYGTTYGGSYGGYGGGYRPY